MNALIEFDNEFDLPVEEACAHFRKPLDILRWRATLDETPHAAGAHPLCEIARLVERLGVVGVDVGVRELNAAVELHEAPLLQAAGLPSFPTLVRGGRE